MFMKILLISLFVVSSMANIALVGKRRKPITPEMSAIACGINILFIILIIYFV